MMRRLDEKVGLLMLSGEKDEIIPPRHMQELWTAASGEEGEVGPASLASSGGANAEKSGKKEKFRWTRLHLDILAKLGLRTHRREESVKSTPSEAPAELEVPKVSRSSTEKARVRSFEGGRRKGRFVSIKDGTHSELISPTRILLIEERCLTVV